MEYSSKKLPFLDIFIKKENGQTTINIYLKLTVNNIFSSKAITPKTV